MDAVCWKSERETRRSEGGKKDGWREMEDGEKDNMRQKRRPRKGKREGKYNSVNSPPNSAI